MSFVLPALEYLDGVLLSSNERVSGKRLFCNSLGELSAEYLALLDKGSEDKLMEYE